MADNTPIDPSSPRVQSPSLHRSHSRPHPRSPVSSDRTLDLEPANAASPPKPEDDVPPDGGYGWVCVACNFFINGHTWGVNSSYGVFLSYYLSHDYFPNTSALAYAFIGGLSISQALLLAPLATYVIQVWGTRVCLHLGVFFETLALIGSSFAHQKWQIVLSQGICFGWGMGFLFVGSVGVPAQWFLEKRSIANAIAAAGSGLGGLMYSLIAQRCIDKYGLPWAFRVLGICTFVVNLTAANLLRDRNTQVGSRHVAFDMALLRRPEFLLLQGWGFFSMLAYTVVLFSLPSYAQAINLTPQQGSIVGAVLNLGQMLGRPFVGLASDRYGRLNLAAFLTFLCGVFCLVFWIPVETTSSPMALLTFFAIVGGTLAGTFWCTVAPVTAEVLGLQDLPAGLSLTWVMMVPPTTVAEAIALEIRRPGARHWAYIGPELFTACTYIAAAACLWVVRGWKVGECEEMDRRRQRTTVEGSREIGHGTHAQLDEKACEEAPEILAELERTRTNSVVKAGWNRKDLVRRMVAWKKV